MNRLGELAAGVSGPALFAFDFPFGYPAGAKLGGGRIAGQKLAKHLQSDEKDRNNRFEVADTLNRNFTEFPGPFWGCPASKSLKNLTPTKPVFSHKTFSEWRIVEKHLRDQGKRIMNVWQLLGQGSVGSQTLTGLAELYNFSERLSHNKNVRFWPFDTNWEQDLDDIVLAEVWPSLNDFSQMNHPIKDARQVMACLKWLWEHNVNGSIKPLFKAPQKFDKNATHAAQTEEGWILGIHDL